MEAVQSDVTAERDRESSRNGRADYRDTKGQKEPQHISHRHHIRPLMDLASLADYGRDQCGVQR
jgi:hypothetical protein